MITVSKGLGSLVGKKSSNQEILPTFISQIRNDILKMENGNF